MTETQHNTQLSLPVAPPRARDGQPARAAAALARQFYVGTATFCNRRFCRWWPRKFSWAGSVASCREYHRLFHFWNPLKIADTICQRSALGRNRRQISRLARTELSAASMATASAFATSRCSLGRGKPNKTYHFSPDTTRAPAGAGSVIALNRRPKRSASCWPRS